MTTEGKPSQESHIYELFQSSIFLKKIYNLNRRFIFMEGLEYTVHNNVKTEKFFPFLNLHCYSPTLTLTLAMWLACVNGTIVNVTGET